ncbi:MAG: hypothetical protein ACLR8P_09445 [Clostridium fessum]
MAASVAGCSTRALRWMSTKAAESGSDKFPQSAAAGEKIFRYSNAADIATIDPDRDKLAADVFDRAPIHIYDRSVPQRAGRASAGNR